ALGVRPVTPKAQKPRPTGLAVELKSSSGTTGFSAAPDTAAGTKVPLPGAPRSAGEPTAPAPPKFSTDSPFVRPVQPRRPKPEPERARPERGERPAARGGERAAERPERPGRGEGPRGRGRAAETPPVVLTVPEIGVMKLKPKRRAGEKGAKGRVTELKPEAESAKPGRKSLRPSKVYGDADEFRRPFKPHKKTRTAVLPEERHKESAKPQVVGPVILTGPLTVAEFAQKLAMSPADLIKAAFLKGQIITINQLINFDLAEEIAFDLNIDLVIAPEGDETDIADYRIVDDEKDMVPRPPVVTIMGHVDHGKTTVLDYYRRSQVVEGEFGGITQHIGAYHVATPRGDVVFLDTPGHEAFTAMRARGVQCTDIVVLVVSADDGVMPQTVEAINHARAANVPIIVAINKIDLPQADPQRVRNELLQHSIVPTAMGGDTEIVEISAKKGMHMDDLLEIINLQAEVLELKANPNRAAEGVVIESHIDALRGAVATILIQKGTLRIGDYFVVGAQSGRVRAMLDDHGRVLRETTLAQPIELIGLSGPPEVGELLLVMGDERKAREIAERREQRRRLVELGTTRHVTLEGLHDMIAAGKIKELNLILKADVQGSVEAIIQSLEKLATSEIRVRILHSGTGSITENDVNLAMASSAIIIGFNVRPEPGAADLAAHEQVDIRLYRIIYELLEDIEKAMVGMLEKRYKEQVLGRSEVRQIFRNSRVGTIAGCMVLSGEMQRGAKCRLLRDGAIAYEGRVASLRRVKDDVARVAAGYECGIALERFQDIKDGDIIEAYALEELPVELSRSQG
ncbi:MAG: translation initiation factor IF-2, partial [bacterium]|nr:translation initiation factor IF-2 [bacterium]